MAGLQKRRYLELGAYAGTAFKYLHSDGSWAISQGRRERPILWRGSATEFLRRLLNLF